MILIADGGSTKVDWVVLDSTKKECFRVKSLGLNPSILKKSELSNRIKNISELIKIKNDISEVYFYGAGCGTTKSVKKMQLIFQNIFCGATINIHEDLLAAALASSGNTEGIICILGTGSNSCFFDGKNIINSVVSLGYTIMDEASGNFFGKQLIRDYFYKKMPKEIAKKIETTFNLNPDFIKTNLYSEPNPNRYLASFAQFMFDVKENKYIEKMIENGFQDFLNFRVLTFKQAQTTPIYFIGSIAYYFSSILEKVTQNNGLKITKIIKRPIDDLILYHQKN